MYFNLMRNTFGQGDAFPHSFRSTEFPGRIIFHWVGTIRINWLKQPISDQNNSVEVLYTTGITAGFMTTSRYNGAPKRSPASWVCDQRKSKYSSISLPLDNSR